MGVSPRPFPRELSGEDPRSARSHADARLGLDTTGRVVFQDLRDDLFVLYDWADGFCDVVQFNGALRQLERLVFADGKLVEEIKIGGGVRYDGALAVQVTRWSYEHGRLASGLQTYESQGNRSIADDPALRFAFIDAGDIHFLGTPDDIKHCRWGRLTVVPNSC